MVELTRYGGSLVEGELMREDWVVVQLMAMGLYQLRVTWE